MDAASWVPQHRERTFIIGLRRDVFGGQRFVFPPIPAARRPVLRDILEPWVDRKYVLTPHLWEYLQAYAQKHRAAGHGFGFGLVGGDDVARTLSARYYKDGSEILDRHRRLDSAPADASRMRPPDGLPEPTSIGAREHARAEPAGSPS